uniref:Peptidoglycan-recognition protein S2-like protein n=1 Tax=Anasa tristis TaxID=236421 RepID=I6QWT7_ANATI|nr:peptidoglycan-recognition protein S2-like protein [Anasa tristis]
MNKDNIDDFVPRPVKSSSNHFGLDCNSQNSDGIFDSQLCQINFDRNKYDIILSPKKLLESPCIATDQAIPLSASSSISNSEKENDPENKGLSVTPSTQEEGNSVLTYAGHELTLSDRREQLGKQSLNPEKHVSDLSGNQQETSCLEIDLDNSYYLSSAQLIEDDKLPIISEGEEEIDLLKQISKRIHPKKQLSGTKNQADVELKGTSSLKADVKDSCDLSSTERIENGVNSSIARKDNVAVSCQELPKAGVFDNFTLGFKECKELPFALQESSSIETDNKKSLCASQDFNGNNRDIFLSKPPSEFIKSDTEVAIANSLPLVFELPASETSIKAYKENFRTLEATGLQHTVNLRPFSSGNKLQKLPQIQHYEGVTIEKSKNISFGTQICSDELTINQYVDLSNVGKEIPPNSQVTVTDSTRSESCCKKLSYFWATLLLGSMITAAVTGASLVFLDMLPETQENEPDGGGDMSANYTLRLITRGQWSHHSVVKLDNYKFRPTPYVVVCHTASNFCTNTEVCINMIRGIESWHINVGFTAIGYNFLIAGDGYIYEGRGWKKVGAHTKGINCKSIGIGFVGDFNKDQLLPSMVEAYNILVEEGVRRGELTQDYTMIGTYQFKNSDSPGQNIRELLKTWPHWRPVTKNDTKCQ